MRALQITRPQLVELLNLPSSEPGQSEIRITVLASGICGTDVHIFKGEYLGGYPVIPGHEFSGVVSAVGKGVTRFVVGDHVAVEPNIPCNNCDACLQNRQNHCRNWTAVGVTRAGGMAEEVIVPESAVFATGSLPSVAGAFVEPLSCVVHGLLKLDGLPGSRILVAGAGPIGLLLTRTARAMGASHVSILEIDTSRAEFAARRDADTLYSIQESVPADSFDIVIDATGVESVLSDTPAWVRPGGSILWFGVPRMDSRVGIDPFVIFQKGLSIHGTFTSVRNSYQALTLLGSGQVHVDDLVSHRLPLAEFEHGLGVLIDRSEPVMKVMILPQE